MPGTTARGSFTWADGLEWFRGFTYEIDRARGLDDGEDLASPGVFTFTLPGDATLVLRADAPGTADPGALAAAERTRRARPAYDVSADAYMAQRGAGHTVLAGFPWFTDWGRDTFIALRGLLIVRGPAGGRQPPSCWPGPAHVSEGMLPNRFPGWAGMPRNTTRRMPPCGSWSRSTS